MIKTKQEEYVRIVGILVFYELISMTQDLQLANESESSMYSLRHRGTPKHVIDSHLLLLGHNFLLLICHKYYDFTLAPNLPSA